MFKILTIVGALAASSAAAALPTPISFSLVSDQTMQTIGTGTAFFTAEYYGAVSISVFEPGFTLFESTFPTFVLATNGVIDQFNFFTSYAVGDGSETSQAIQGQADRNSAVYSFFGRSQGVEVFDRGHLTFAVAAVPEPASYVLLLGGMALVGAAVIKRSKSSP